MCSRLRSLKTLSQLPFVDPRWILANFESNPNVAPTDSLPIIRTDADQNNQLTLAKFGLVHSWANDTKQAFRYINTRAETIREKPAFKTAYQKRRCIIPVLGFYEWKEEGGKKQPYYFSLKSGDTLPLIGIWEYAELLGEKIYSFSIVTGEPNSLIAQFHDRMPLATKDPLQWLDLSKDSLLTLPAYGPDDYKVYPVDPIINNSRNKEIPESIFD